MRYQIPKRIIQTGKTVLQTPAYNDLCVPAGALDGLTIMRYAHIYRDRVSGGVEQYLRHLDRGLLQRHHLTVLQMYLTRDDKNDAIDVENVGMGRILWLPVPLRQMDWTLADLPNRMGYIFGQTYRQYRRQGGGRYRAILLSLQGVLQHHCSHFRYDTTILSDHLARLLVTQNVDLLALHWLFYDTDALISSALEARIPFVLINHFDNERFSRPAMQKWIGRAAAIGAVSDQGIPDDLRGRCFNLSDAVDTEFFTPEKARSMRVPADPIVLLPARIYERKGHRDLIEAARILIARKVGLVLCFAGAVDSEPLYQELLGLVAAAGIEERVLFLGEKSAEEMRDLYAISSVVVLPSYSEGLGRVLIEAQAMKKPVVAYDNGGMREAVLQNETGSLIETGDVKALADKIGFLLQNEAERSRIGQRGREFVSSKFSISSLIQRHETFYLSALSRARMRN